MEKAVGEADKAGAEMILTKNQEVTDSARGQILNLLAERRSPYGFSMRRVEAEKLRRLFQAARWAPSSYNEQPWSFLVATRDNPEDYDRLLNTLVEFNRQWAGQAPVLALGVAKLAFDRDGRTNRHAWYDLGQAVADLTVQATAEGLSVHQMAGFDAEKARQEFQIPAGYEPVVVMAIGYPDDSEVSESGRPRSRKPLKEFVFGGSWGQTSTLVASDFAHEGGFDDQSN